LNLSSGFNCSYYLLYCVRNRCLLYTNTAIINYQIDLFQKEREQLQEFLSSSSGYALHLWVP
jgi:hypothetical protein